MPLFDTFLLIFTWVHWCCSVLGVAVCCIGCFSIEVTMCCCFRMNTCSFVILILHWNILFLILCNFVSLFDINHSYLKSFFYGVLFHLSQFSPLLPQSSPPCFPCPWVIYTCSLTSPFSSFSPYHPLTSPLVAVSLFLVSMPLVLFCSFVLLIQFLL